MNEISGFIVVLWLYPVALFIVTPLCMLAGWAFFKFITHLSSMFRVTIAPSASVQMSS